MEKIIAVVVMIAIVIGLIATAVMPMVSQMNAQGGAASDQLNVIGQTVTDSNVVTGTVVKSEVQSQMAKFALATDPITKISLLDNGGATKAEMTDSTTYGAFADAVSDSGLYRRATTYHNSGKVSTLTYTLQ